MSKINCDCEYWKTGMKALDACTNSAWTHGVQYTGKFFKYCPWCGERLFDENGVLPDDRG